ncbi:MAG TPA: diadenylate cyclase CdaA [Longimicrobiaceae bacterium]|nr:diadenylate cyclase CdaA [Longimicrobiaceae bacterium]
MSEFAQRFGFLRPDWKDAFEILIVAFVFYRVLLLLAGTRAIQMLLGLFSLVAFYVVAHLLNLSLLEYLLEGIFKFGVFALLIVFQPELRSALAHLGQSRFLRLFSRLQERELAEEITEAAVELSRSKVGAIIAIEREVGLAEYAASGTRLQANVSSALLQNLFTPYSPLHDGAVVIRGDEIVAAGAILPLTQFPVADRQLGTRHRAALGLSEESDAVVLVVSEETGTISVAHRGILLRHVTPEHLSDLLAGRVALPRR